VRSAPAPRTSLVGHWPLSYRTRYWDFTVKHFHEALQAEHGFSLGYTWTKMVLQSRGLVAIAPRRSAHRKKRPRRPLPGMMLFQDGSPHEWLVGQAPLDLIVTLDDATSAIYSIFLVEEEGTASSFRGLDEVISRHGLFCSFYTDRGSHYFTTPKAGGKVDKQQLTQVGRALGGERGLNHADRLFLGEDRRVAVSHEVRGASLERTRNRQKYRDFHRRSLRIRLVARNPEPIQSFTTQFPTPRNREVILA